jgi:hypothetical protein
MMNLIALRYQALMREALTTRNKARKLLFSRFRRIKS